MKYMEFIWFCIRVLLTATIFIVPLLAGIIILISMSRLVGMGVLVPCDKAMAAIIYRKRYRTISGICGERKLVGRRGYTLIANFINYLATCLGDELLHCEREYKKETEAILRAKAKSY